MAAVTEAAAVIVQVITAEAATEAAAAIDQATAAEAAADQAAAEAAEADQAAAPEVHHQVQVLPVQADVKTYKKVSSLFQA